MRKNRNWNSKNFKRNIEEKTGGKTRADAKTCMENAYVDRLNAVGDDDSDYTKVPDFYFYQNF